MFAKNSRYYGLKKVAGKDATGRSVQAVKLRLLPNLPEAEAGMVLTDGSYLDLISERQYRDATRFWHIADANSELEAGELVRSPGRLINVPKR